MIDEGRLGQGFLFIFLNGYISLHAEQFTFHCRQKVNDSVIQLMYKCSI